MTTTLTDPYLQAAYEAARSAAEQDEEQNLLCDIVGCAARKHDLSSARHVLREILPGMHAFWARLIVYETQPCKDDYHALREMLERLGTCSGLRRKDLLCYIESIRAMESGEHTESHNQIRLIREPTRRAQALVRLFAKSQSQGALDDLLTLKTQAEMRVNAAEHASMQTATERMAEKNLINELIKRALGHQRPSVLERSRIRWEQLLEGGAPSIILYNEAILLITAGDFETPVPYFEASGWSKTDEPFIAAYAIGHAVRGEFDEAERLAASLINPRNRCQAFLEIYSAKHKQRE